MKRSPCVLSVAEHTGWAYVVCVAAEGHAPAVVDRKRVTLIEPGLPTQPYEHDTRALTEDDANAMIVRVPTIRCGAHVRRVAACADGPGALLLSRRARHPEVAVRRAPHHGRGRVEVAPAALLRGRDAVSARHLPRGDNEDDPKGDGYRSRSTNIHGGPPCCHQANDYRSRAVRGACASRERRSRSWWLSSVRGSAMNCSKQRTLHCNVQDRP